MTRPLLVLLLVCCAPPSYDARRVWTTADLRAEPPDENVGGWKAGSLVSAEGQLKALPGFSEGRPVAFVITELWYESPNPWVQPVYVDPSHSDVRPVFPVGAKGSFYSPFWRAVQFENPSNLQLTDATQVLNQGGELTFGDIVVCPFVPSDTTVARTHPLTNAALAPFTMTRAWLDGADVFYVPIGLDRVRGEGDRVDESKLFAFVKPDGGSWPLPAVLDDDLVHRSFSRRYDVSLPVTARAFWPVGVPVPAGLTDIVGAPDPGLDDVALRLRVATNPECFRADAGFPTSCHWLDSRARIETTFAPVNVQRTEVTVTAARLLEAP